MSIDVCLDNELAVQSIGPCFSLPTTNSSGQCQGFGFLRCAKLNGILSSLFVFFVAAFVSMPQPNALAAEMPIDEAWKTLPTYQYGQDMVALLAIDREAIHAMATPASRSAYAARLAAFLEADKTTLPAKQYICCRLRHVGTAAEVPILARLLAKPETSQMARYALESMPGEPSAAALRDALGTLQGDLLIGTINSVAAKRDCQAVPRLKEIAAGKDAKTAATALWALGNIANPEAIAFVRQRADETGNPMPSVLAVSLLRCADALAAAGDAEQAKSIYVKLAEVGQAAGVRRASLAAILQSEKDHSAESVLSWISGVDADRRVVAIGQLAKMPDAELDRLAAKLTALPYESQLGLLDVLAARKGKDALPLALAAAKSDKPEMRLVGIRMLGQIGDVSALAVLTECLSKTNEESEAAKQALCRLPREAVGNAMLVALQEQSNIRSSVLEVLKKLKYHEAVDSLIAIAGQENAAVYEPALDALREIADPNAADLSRLVTLLLAVQGEHREAVERVIFVICRKPDASVCIRHISTAGASEIVSQGSTDASVDYAKPLLEVLAKVDASELPKYLPLLGRFGGTQTMERIESSLVSEKPELKAAAARALCNWPGADAADRLWTLANGDDPQFRQWSMRAYVRVVTLKSDRPAPQTLAMLQRAMTLAKSPEDQQWVLHRASTVRTMDAAIWIAGYLDDPDVNQTACESIVALAHHRFLRQPNMDRFGPMLEKVSSVSKNSSVVERAKKYQLGL